MPPALPAGTNDSHLTDEEVEAWGSEPSCPRPPSRQDKKARRRSLRSTLTPSASIFSNLYLAPITWLY